MLRRIERLLRRATVVALALLIAAPEIAMAIDPPKSSKSLDAMSDAELKTFVDGLNQSANWRKYRRPSDPPDFVPGKPVRVMHGAGAMLGRGGRGGGRSFRQSGLANRRGGAIGSSRRRGGGRNDQSAMESSRGSSRGSSSSSGSRSSFGSGSRSSFGSGGNTSFGNSNGFNNFE
jgi:hypothetical protein